MQVKINQFEIAQIGLRLFIKLIHTYSFSGISVFVTYSTEIKVLNEDSNLPSSINQLGPESYVLIRF